MNISQILDIDVLDLAHCRGAVVLAADQREKLRVSIFVSGFDHGLRTGNLIFSPLNQPHNSFECLPFDVHPIRSFHRFPIALKLLIERSYTDFFSTAV